MPPTTLMACLVVAAAAAGLVLALQRAWDLDSPAQVLTELLAGALPWRGRDAQAVLRRIVRRIGGCSLVSPSGGRVAFGVLTVRLHPDDRARLLSSYERAAVEEELARSYVLHARRQGWRLPAAAPVVVVQSDLRVPPGAVRVYGRAGHAGAQGTPDAAGPPVSSPIRSGAASPPFVAAGPRPGAGAGAGAGHGPRRGPSLLPRTVVLGPDDPAAAGATAGAAVTRAPADTPTRADAGAAALVLTGLDGAPDARVGPDVPASGAVLGRAVTCAVRSLDPDVSREHARLTRRGATWAVTDLGSTNGTFVNGVRVREAVLRPGDVLGVGLDGPRWRVDGAPG